MSYKHIYFAPKNPDGTYGAISRADYDDELYDKEFIMAGFLGKEIIPCKDCKYWDYEVDNDVGFCVRTEDCDWNADDFCSRGERKKPTEF